MHYTLRQLEVFVAVAQHESVSHAARALAMSQSATSTSLAELERRKQHVAVVSMCIGLGGRLLLCRLLSYSILTNS